MADPAAAFGMYTFKSSRQGKPADLGQDGRIEDYYLNFWKGPVLVTITALDEAAGVREGMVPLARAVDAQIAQKGERPAIMDALPDVWTKAARIVYLRGFIGLNNIRVLYPSDLFKFREAVAVERAGFTAFLFGYGSADEASRRFAEVGKAFKGSPLYKSVKTPAAGAIEAAEAKGGRLAARLLGNRIGLAIVAADAPPGTTPEALIAQLK